MKRSFLFLLSIAFVILLVRCDSNVSKDSKVDEVKVNESIMDENFEKRLRNTFLHQCTTTYKRFRHYIYQLYYFSSK